MSLNVAFLVFPGFQLLNLSGPLAAFEIANGLVDSMSYRTAVVSLNGGAVNSSAGVSVMTMEIELGDIDTVVVVGSSVQNSPELLTSLAMAVRRYARCSRRVASICTGAFVLAEASLLDGHKATTHWQYVAKLQKLYPSVKVDGDRIFTKSSSVWTSAGNTAGIDLALAMIEDDFGAEISACVARMLVIPQQRSGGQSQYSDPLELETGSNRIQACLQFARAHLNNELSVVSLAKVAGLSPRQFGRAFQTETGETPAKVVERMRADFARVRIETSDDPIEQIAHEAGFTTLERMRRSLLRRFGHPPQALRRAARADVPR